MVDYGELLRLLEPPSWHADAACKEAPPDVTWFPTKRGSEGPAKAVCARCLVRDECASWVLAQGSELDGIFGGMTARERTAIRRGRAA